MLDMIDVCLDLVEHEGELLVVLLFLDDALLVVIQLCVHVAKVLLLDAGGKERVKERGRERGRAGGRE